MASPEALPIGRIVWAEIADLNGIRKQRPAIIVSSTDAAGTLTVVAVTRSVRISSRENSGSKPLRHDELGAAFPTPLLNWIEGLPRSPVPFQPLRDDANSPLGEYCTESRRMVRLWRTARTLPTQGQARVPILRRDGMNRRTVTRCRSSRCLATLPHHRVDPIVMQVERQDEGKQPRG